MPADRLARVTLRKSCRRFRRSRTNTPEVRKPEDSVFEGDVCPVIVTARKISPLERSGCGPADRSGLGAQLRAALGAARGQDGTAAFGGHAGAETMPAFADQAARLESAFHGSYSD